MYCPVQKQLVHLSLLSSSPHYSIIGHCIEVLWPHHKGWTSRLKNLAACAISCGFLQYDGSTCLKNFTKLTSSYSSFMLSFAQKDVQRFWYCWYIFLTGFSIFFSSSSASIFSIISDISSSLTFRLSIQVNASMPFTALSISWLGSTTVVVVVLLPLLPPSCLSHVVEVEVKSFISLIFFLSRIVPHTAISLFVFFYFLHKFLYLLIAWSFFDYVIFWFVIIKFCTCLFGEKIVIYATRCNNFEYIAPHWHNTYIYYIVVNIRMMTMRCNIFKIIAPSCVHNFLLPHMRLLLSMYFNSMLCRK